MINKSIILSDSNEQAYKGKKKRGCENLILNFNFKGNVFKKRST